MISYKSGFIAQEYPIVDDSLIPTPTPQSTIISSLALSTLAKLFWKAKSFDWSINFGYSLSLPGGGFTRTTAGSISANGTALIETPRTAPRATGALPGERTIAAGNMPIGAYWLPSPPNPMGSSGGTIMGPFSDAGNVTSTDPSFTPSPYSASNVIFQLFWFLPQTSSIWSAETGYQTCLITKSGGNYITRVQTGALSLGFAAFAVGGASAEFSIYQYSGWLASGLNLTIKITGVADTVLPLYWPAPTAFSAHSLSGGIVVDFNNFWTP